MPMPPRGPIDMLFVRNCACEPVVAAATIATASAVEIDSNPICPNRLADERIAIPPRKILKRENDRLWRRFYGPAVSAKLCPARPLAFSGPAAGVLGRPGRSVRDGLLEWRPVTAASPRS